MTKKFGLIGAGAMGTQIALAIDQGVVGGSLAAVFDLDEHALSTLVSKLEKKPAVAQSLEELFTHCEFIIEAASQQAVNLIIPKAIDAGLDVMVMSVGALVDPKLARQVFENAREKNVRVYIPSGALAGIDAVFAASFAKIDEITLTSTKPPKGLEGVKYLEENDVDVFALTEPVIVYEGMAYEAAALFPKNINVAAVASLAAAKPAKVRIICDPNTKSNSHQIRAVGNFGTIEAKTSNTPSPDNPKTSYLAILSAISTLSNITSHSKIGN